jgi:hypothetical protein
MSLLSESAFFLFVESSLERVLKEAVVSSSESSFFLLPIVFSGEDGKLMEEEV